MKICAHCKEQKPSSSFGKDKSRKDGLRYWCSVCRNARHQEVVASLVYTSCDRAICTSCKTEKSVSDFPKDRGRKNGLSTWCRQCYRVSRQRTQPQRLIQMKQYREKNPGIMSASHADWVKRNPDYRPNYVRKYRAEKPYIQASLNAKYRASLKRATPAWADFKAIARLYKEADRLTRETGIKHQVDHFYPLQSEVMCGLHVEANLHVIPAAINQAKGNRIVEVESPPRCCAWPFVPPSIDLSSVLVQ